MALIHGFDSSCLEFRRLSPGGVVAESQEAETATNETKVEVAEPRKRIYRWRRRRVVRLLTLKRG